MKTTHYILIFIIIPSLSLFLYTNRLHNNLDEEKELANALVQNIRVGDTLCVKEKHIKKFFQGAGDPCGVAIDHNEDDDSYLISSREHSVLNRSYHKDKVYRKLEYRGYAGATLDCIDKSGRGLSLSKRINKSLVVHSKLGTKKDKPIVVSLDDEGRNDVTKHLDCSIRPHE